MKRIGKIISVATLIFVIASAFSPRALAAESCWYVRRNGECRPGFPADAEEVSQYDGFYIDNNCERGAPASEWKPNDSSSGTLRPVVSGLNTEPPER